MSSDSRFPRPQTSSTSLSMASKNVLPFSKNSGLDQALHNHPSSVRPAPPPFHSPSPAPRNKTMRRSPRDSFMDRDGSKLSAKRTGLERRASSRIDGNSSDLWIASKSSGPGFSQPLNKTRIQKNGNARAPRVTRPSTAPEIRQTTSQAPARPNFMKRWTRRLQSSSSRDEDDPASLPIQRVPSYQRKPIRVNSSHRTSRRLSARPPAARSSSARLSRTASVLLDTGYPIPSSRPASALRENAVATPMGNEDSNYSTESEPDEQPITMRSPRLERARMAALVAGTQSLESVSPVSEDPVTALIEEITEQLEGRASRDTMSTAYEFSLNDYFNAFPTPPTPGLAPSLTSEIPLPRARDPPVVDDAVTGSLSVDASQLHLSFGSSHSWDDWTSRALGPLDTLPEHSVLEENQSVAYLQDRIKVDAVQPRSSPIQWEQSFPLAYARTPSPQAPEVPSFARSRNCSMDPLAQARRRTQVVSGQVVDLAEQDNDDTIEDAPRVLMNKHYRAEPTIDVYVASGRRASDRSILSSGTQPEVSVGAASISSASFDNAYSLNSPSDDEDDNIGVALTTEYRELATPSPVAGAGLDDPSLTLYARRKGRQPEVGISTPPLRLEMSNSLHTVPETPSTALSSAQSLTTSGSSHFDSATSKYTPQALPIGNRLAPVVQQPKKRSFFKYPFLSKRSTGSLRTEVTIAPSRVSPPLASPRALNPPMSASSTKETFQQTGLMKAPSLVAGRQPTTLPKSKFISFSRPSSSRGRI